MQATHQRLCSFWNTTPSCGSTSVRMSGTCDSIDRLRASDAPTCDVRAGGAGRGGSDQVEPGQVESGRAGPGPVFIWPAALVM